MHQRSVEALPNISSTRSNANTIAELSLYSKLGRATAPKVVQGAMVDDDLEAHQGTKDNLHGELPLTVPMPGLRRRWHNGQLSIKP